MAAKKQGLAPSAPEIQAARAEAARRIAREEALLAHQERFRAFHKHVSNAIKALDIAFPDEDHKQPDPWKRRVMDGLEDALCAIPDPPPLDEPSRPPPHVPEPLGPNRGWTPTELEGFRRKAVLELNEAEAAGDVPGATVARDKLDRICETIEAARVHGLTDQVLRAAQERRVREAEARKGDVRKARADEQRAWMMAPARAAQPRESIDDVAARILVDRGHSPFAAARVLLGSDSDTTRDKGRHKVIARAYAKQRERENAQPQPRELSPDEADEMNAAIAARSNQRSPRSSR